MKTPGGKLAPNLSHFVGWGGVLETPKLLPIPPVTLWMQVLILRKIYRYASMITFFPHVSTFPEKVPVILGDTNFRGVELTIVSGNCLRGL